MRTIKYATTNKGKVAELRTALSKFGIEPIQTAIDLPEPRADDVEPIASAKVLFAYSKLQEPCLALDGGFYVYDLKGFPKAFVNFALDTIDIEGILKLVEDKDRSCEFRNCLAYMDNTLAAPRLFSNIVKGTLSYEPRGEPKEYIWGRLWYIFVPEGKSKSLAEMSEAEYYDWKRERDEDALGSKFGRWYSRQTEVRKIDASPRSLD